KVHEPWKLLPVEQKRFGVRLGVDYPTPVVDLFQSAQENESIYNQALYGHSNRAKEKDVRSHRHSSKIQNRPSKI
ncbi:MAG TPA: hypothetical protein IGR64_15260, partial [Leptolyngbyaceae cyanobacterium M65_K2018_010]|nr:hypothetical protein [Leptolyngbyaceae cyanobacterium M65_K2018_010]